MRSLYRAARVVTLAHPAVGEWLLVDGRHVQRVGRGEPPEADRVIDLPGATIVPGFVDAHVHLTGTGIHEAEPRLAAATSAEEALAVAREVAADGTAPTLLHGFDESRWIQPRLPTLDELDRASERPLLLVRTDGHLTLANTPALGEVGVSDLPGSGRDAEDRPTGVLTQAANDRAKRWYSELIDDREIQALQLRAAGLAASRGVTTVHEMSMPKERGLRDLQVLLGHRRDLPVDLAIYVATMDIPQAIDLGLSGVGGDLPVDGSIGAGTANVLAPYEDGSTGVAYHADDELAEFFHNGHLAGLQVGVHAIGDAAIEQVLGCWERVYQALDSRDRRHFRARRHRVEHFEMPGYSQIERAAMLGLGISVQPSFDATWGHPGGLYESRLGRERAAAMNPFRSLLERGVELGIGTDAPITELDPMAAIDALERHHDPAQRVSRAEALRLATTGSARLAHLGGKKGRLEPGMHADFAAYDVDPTAEERLAGVRPTLTVSLGREVFAS